MRPRFLRLLAGVLLAALAASACVSDAGEPNNLVGENDPSVPVPTTTIPTVDSADTDLVVTVVSSDPDKITGGDARIRIRTEDPATATVTVRLNGEDVSAAFPAVEDGVTEGVVESLALGANTLAVTEAGRTYTTALENHPRRGPVFSGPQAEPLACSTGDFGLGPAEDQFCSAPTQVYWNYIDGAGTLRRLEGSAQPADVGTITVGARTVPAIIRTEIGTINRSVYWIHTLDPRPRRSAGWSGAGVWNDRLVFDYGGGCNATRGQGRPSSLPQGYREENGPLPDLDLLRRGYAVASATFGILGVACNDVLTAETTMMVRERFVERYGEPALTLGQGRSGGAVQQLLVAQNYPGLLDGLVASIPLPDIVTTWPTAVDCRLLGAYYADGGADLSPDQRLAIEGFASPATCGQMARLADAVDPAAGCDPAVAPRSFQIGTRVDGVRCTPWDADPGLYGGRRLGPLDNVGVQYGLDALVAGVIDVDEFVALNEGIGGVAPNGAVVGERMDTDVELISTMYEQGRVNQAGGDGRRIPILVIDATTDQAGDIHDRRRAMEVIDRVAGGATEPPPNVAAWTVVAPVSDVQEVLTFYETDPLLDRAEYEAVETVDLWATRLAATPDGQPRPLALAATRPTRAGPRCLLRSGGVLLAEEATAPGSPCLVEASGDPRAAAGGLAMAVLKCQLRPVRVGDYGGSITGADLQRIRAVFPDGVCHPDRPGAGRLRVDAEWIDYSDPSL